MALASPTRMFRTPSGMPALCASSASASAVSGVDSAGFRITCSACVLSLMPYPVQMRFCPDAEIPASRVQNMRQQARELTECAIQAP